MPTPLDRRLDEALRESFGLDELRPWQREAINALVDEPGKVLVVAPTGGGKSLCYQLPAVVLGGTTVVVSPLISLMEDQVRALVARGIPATFLASTLDHDERAARFRAIRSGAMRLVYVAPERLADRSFVEFLADLEPTAVVVDEAHCIVQWGHDFRPDYLRIGELVERLRPRRVLACTATATPESRDEIVARLGLDPAKTAVVLRGFARPNLELTVREVEGPKEAERVTHVALVAALGEPSRPAGAGIVYAATRKTTEKLAERLRARGWRAEAYHAGLAGEERTRVQAAFSDRSLPVVVATNAFGMGIDRPDVRVVVHAQPSASIEAYYQEVGRAGRDGARAHGLLLHAPADIATRRRLVELGSDGGEADAAQAARAWAQFRSLLQYVDARSCRHDFILRHFGDEAESLGGCGHCDVCRDVDRALENDPDVVAAEALVVRKALSGVARAARRGGQLAIVEMLRGEKTERVSRFRFDELSTFGLLAELSVDDVKGVMRALLAAGLVDLTPGEFPVPFVTAPGARVMRGDEAPRIRLGLGRRKPRALVGGAPSRKARVGAAKEPLPEGVDEVLFAALKAHRAAIAREAGVPAYVVAHDRTLAEIAALAPTSLDALAEVRGMGASKVAKWGQGFVDVVRGAPGG